MDLLFKQLGGLVLGSLPTMILFLITLAAYRLLVHGPLTKVLRDRYARTQGAIENAAAAVAQAENRTSEYEHRIREARAGIFRERHERLHKVHVESEIALAEARAAAQERIGATLVTIEESAGAARLQLDEMIGGLTADVLRAVLPSGRALAAGSAPAQEQAG
jgi:F-type H+-transporting ATPase subunit b